MRTSKYCEVQGLLIAFAEYTVQPCCLEKERKKKKRHFQHLQWLEHLFVSSMVRLQQVEAHRICPETAQFLYMWLAKLSLIKNTQTGTGSN